jgi:glycogen operon protein
LTDDLDINHLRRKQMKNAIALLLMSQGVPMILMGDELGHSKHGNNNTYCHDNQFNWLDWSLSETNADLFRFFQNCIAFRKVHPTLKNWARFRHEDDPSGIYAEVSWHSVEAWKAEWGDYILTLAFMVSGEYQVDDGVVSEHIYVAMNMHWEDHEFTIPELPDDFYWHLFVDTGVTPPDDICLPGDEPRLIDQQALLVHARSVVILVGR